MKDINSIVRPVGSGNWDQEEYNKIPIPLIVGQTKRFTRKPHGWRIIHTKWCVQAYTGLHIRFTSKTSKRIWNRLTFWESSHKRYGITTKAPLTYKNNPPKKRIPKKKESQKKKVPKEDLNSLPFGGWKAPQPPSLSSLCSEPGLLAAIHLASEVNTFEHGNSLCQKEQQTSINIKNIHHEIPYH